jgi:hypothetical protein
MGIDPDQVRYLHARDWSLSIVKNEVYAAASFPDCSIRINVPSAALLLSDRLVAEARRKSQGTLG